MSKASLAAKGNEGSFKCMAGKELCKASSLSNVEPRGSGKELALCGDISSENGEDGAASLLAKEIVGAALIVCNPLLRPKRGSGNSTGLNWDDLAAWFGCLFERRLSRDNISMLARLNSASGCVLACTFAADTAVAVNRKLVSVTIRDERDMKLKQHLPAPSSWFDMRSNLIETSCSVRAILCALSDAFA
jgi:hypothetical protein